MPEPIDCQSDLIAHPTVVAVKVGAGDAFARSPILRRRCHRGKIFVPSIKLIEMIKGAVDMLAR
jgi:hypothetical protein